MPKYRSNPDRLAHLHRFALRRLGTAFLIGTQAQVDRWLAAVEQTKRRSIVANQTSPLMAALTSI